MALAVAVRAGQHLDRADRVHPDLGRFPQADAGAERADRLGRRDAAGLDVVGEADAAQLAPPRRLALALAEALVVDELHRLVERRRVVADVVVHDDRRLVRELLHEVALAEARGVDAELAGRHLDEPLDDEGRLRPARAAIGVDRRGVGVDRVDLGVDRRDVVLAGQERGVEIGRHRRGEGREIGAHVGRRVDPEAEDLALVVGRELGMRDVIAAVRVRQERLAAVARPLHRPLQAPRRPQADDLLGVDEDLRAEAAADVGGDDAQLVLRRDADEGRQHQAGDVRVLARRVQREDAGAGIVVADRRARLHRVRHEPVVDDVEPGDVVRLGEGLLRLRLVAELPLVDEVAGGDLVDLGRALLPRLRGIRHGVEDLVVDLDHLGGVTRLALRLRDHHRHLVADIAHRVAGDRGVRAGLHRLAVLGMDEPAADQVADRALVEVVARGHELPEVLAGVDRHHARGRLRGRDVDRPDPRMGVRRAHEDRVQLAGPVYVVGVVALACDEPAILHPRDAGADATLSHDRSPPRDCRSAVASPRGVIRQRRAARPRSWLRRRR